MRSPHQLPYRIRRQPVATRSNRLIENGKGVTHRAVSRLGQQCQRVLVGCDFFLINQGSQLSENVFEAHGAETEVLATRADRLRDIFRLCRGQHENHVARRFLQRLQQCIESRIGNLVGFVEDVDLETISRRTVTGCLAQLAYFIDTAVCGSINLNHIHHIAGTNFGAGVANTTGLRHGVIR